MGWWFKRSKTTLGTGKQKKTATPTTNLQSLWGEHPCDAAMQSWKEKEVDKWGGSKGARQHPAQENKKKTTPTTNLQSLWGEHPCDAAIALVRASFCQTHGAPTSPRAAQQDQAKTLNSGW
jgi:hypothetical protein